MFLVAGVKPSLCLPYVYLRAVLAGDLVYYPSLVQVADFVLGVYEPGPDGVGGFEVYLYARLTDVSRHRFRDGPHVGERDAAFHWCGVVRMWSVPELRGVGGCGCSPGRLGVSRD